MGFLRRLFGLKPTNTELHQANLRVKTQRAVRIYPRKNKLDFSDFVVIDFETTGFSPAQDYIVQVGAVRFRNGEPVDTIKSYVKPLMPIPPQATRVNGITNAMLASAPTIELVLPGLIDFIGKDIIVAHNARFDMGFLLANTPSEISNKVFCTLEHAQNHYAFGSHKLVNLVKTFNIDAAATHDALDDCLACGKIAMRMKIDCEITKAIDDGDRFEKGENPLKAIPHYERAISMGANVIKPFERLAIIYRKEKDYDNEIRICNLVEVVFQDQLEDKKYYNVSSRKHKAQTLKEKASS